MAVWARLIAQTRSGYPNQPARPPLRELMIAHQRRHCIPPGCRRYEFFANSPLPGAQWQRCVVHFYRNVFSLVPSGKVRDVSKMLKAIHAQEDRKAAAEKMRTVIADLRAKKLVKAAELLEESGHETLTYYGFPDSHWIKLRTNNPLERIMREIRRRTRVVGAFPDGKSCLNLAAARLRHIAGTQWSTRKYMNMTPLFADQTQGTSVA